MPRQIEQQQSHLASHSPTREYKSYLQTPHFRILFSLLLVTSFIAVYGSLQTEKVDATGSQPPPNPPGDTVPNEDSPAQLSQNECKIGGWFPETIQKWADMIDYATKKYRNDFKDEINLNVLISSVMLQESGGDPLSYSSDGAVGLLQVMPRDGIAANFQCINGPCFASRPSIDELQDPGYNLDFGIRMLVGLRLKYGSWREALKYYGPAGVDYYYAKIVLAIYEKAINHPNCESSSLVSPVAKVVSLNGHKIMGDSVSNHSRQALNQIVSGVDFRVVKHQADQFRGRMNQRA